MVMNKNGNSVPSNTGPVPSMNLVTAGILSSGIANRIAMASSSTVPIFRNVLR